MREIPAVMKIGIMGTPSASGNRGVQALGEALVRLCLESTTCAEISMFGSSRSVEPVVMYPQGHKVLINQVVWRMSLRGGLRNHLLVILGLSLVYRFGVSERLRNAIREYSPWIKSVAECDLVGDVRGGDSFSDIYGFNRFFLASLPVLSVILIRGSIVLFPQTYGPFKGRVARKLAQYILRNASTRIARDVYSREACIQLAADGRSVVLSPDVAFALHVRMPEKALVTPPIPPEAEPSLIGINVNGLLYSGGYNRNNQFNLKLNYQQFMLDLINGILAETTHHLLLVPHTFAVASDPESDNGACESLFSALPAALQGRVHILCGEYDAHELKAIIGRCNIFIGARMHSCIAALSQGVPCIGIAYSMKFKGVFATVGMEDWVIDARSMDSATAIRACMSLLTSGQTARISLRERALAVQQILRDLFRELVNTR